ncbi:MAG: hypothetical protein B0W54_08160 [Cellvibrio sp. 79]|nr:MAG: hypothetical protein B0W54_08160 [Cellvibrio sp. 79]
MNKSLLQEISESFFMSEIQIERIFVRAPYAYKLYTIPKRSGGLRNIAQPAKETKYVQSWLIHNVFSSLPVHDCAMAYKSGSSIKENALAHVEKPYLVKFDFKDFFTSIKEANLIAHFQLYLGGRFSSEEIKYLARISCIKYKHATEKCLSVGAPSSPILSNSILFEFDKSVHEWCVSKNIVYTRYADDLTFSLREKGMASTIEAEVRNFAKTKCVVNLRFNQKKTTHLSKKCQRRITGLVITNEDKISLGRDRKREIKALIHQHLLGMLNADQVSNLQGLLGFAKNIEPSFLFSLYKKYTFEVVNGIIRSRKTK